MRVQSCQEKAMSYFATCIFVSAFLIFQVQPIIARYILPWFGGTPAVWSTVMLFFQVLLTGGYAYANWLIGRTRRRELVHLILLGASILLLLGLGLVWKSPITPDAGWKPQASDSPLWAIFRLLFISVGLPYFLLSTNSPLMQAWYSRLFPEKTAYRLYALSNVGSLLGLVTYPILVEPYLTLAWQGRVWSLLYLCYAALAAYGAVKSWRSARQPAAAPGPEARPLEQRPAARRYLLWIGLAATASILLLATTSQLTQEVAVIPFLWVLPLTIYLLSFVLAFSGERWYSRPLYLVLFFAATLLAAWALGRSDAVGIWIQIGIYSLALFAACMVCHGELYRLRPHPSYLTLFYLMVSIGGALGGLIINFVAPYAFHGYWELPLGMALCWLLFLAVVLGFRAPLGRRAWLVVSRVLLFSGLAISGVRAYQQIRADLSGDIFVQRNFYGVVRVLPMETGSGAPSGYMLIHGITIHGVQLLGDGQRDLPTIHFGPTSGGGLALLNHPAAGHGMRVGIVGLGIGTLAAYGQPGDLYRFYEINPVMIHLAEGQGGYFSFLADSRAEIEIVPGDARLSLESELESGQLQDYDILVLDAFSSDSIPVHLLDAESLEVYLQQLRPDGLLAVHISNRHVDLVPVLWTLADHFGLARAVIDDAGDGVVTNRSRWFLMARDPALLEVPAIASRASPMDGYTSRARLWTDDYSNLFQILR
jgi:hypothetical protein